MSRRLNLLYITDQPAGFAGDTLRGLAQRHGMTVVTQDIRAFSSQSLHEPAAFIELNRKAWLKSYDAAVFARFQAADVLFVESSQFALSWVSRAGFGKPLVARLCLDDCERPGVHMVDWSTVRHAIFPDTLSQATFHKLVGSRMPATRTSVVPLHLDDSRFVDAGSGGLSMRLAGDTGQEAGLATALAVFDALPQTTLKPRLVIDDTAAVGATVAGRRADLATGRAGAARHDIVIEAGSHSGEPAYGYVLAAAPSLQAAWSVLIHTARGARPLLLKDRTCVQTLFTKRAVVFKGPDAAAAALIAMDADQTGNETGERIAWLRTRCGSKALDALAFQIRAAARQTGRRPPGLAKVRAWAVKRLTRLKGGSAAARLAQPKSKR